MDGNKQQEQHEEVQALIARICEAKCPDPECIAGMDKGAPSIYKCRTCNGTGYHPLAQVLRVECPHTKQLGTCPTYDINNTVKANKIAHNSCTGTRPATPEEAEALGLKLLEALSAQKYDPLISNHWDNKSRWWGIRLTSFNHRPIHGDTILMALLRAVEQAAGAEEGS